MYEVNFLIRICELCFATGVDCWDPENEDYIASSLFIITLEVFEYFENKDLENLVCL